METFFEEPFVAMIVAVGITIFLSQVGTGIRGWMTSRSRRHDLAADREMHERRIKEAEKLDEVLSIMVADEAMADTLSERIEAARAKVRVEVDSEPEPEEEPEVKPRKRKRRKAGAEEDLPFVKVSLGRGKRKSS